MDVGVGVADVQASVQSSTGDAAIPTNPVAISTAQIAATSRIRLRRGAH
ncbi:hypothetical protein [Humibacter soli]